MRCIIHSVVIFVDCCCYAERITDEVPAPHSGVRIRSAVFQINHPCSAVRCSDESKGYITTICVEIASAGFKVEMIVTCTCLSPVLPFHFSTLVEAEDVVAYIGHICDINRIYCFIHWRCNKIPTVCCASSSRDTL